jgi:hypothetical protein
VFVLLVAMGIGRLIAACSPGRPRGDESEALARARACVVKPSNPYRILFAGTRSQNGPPRVSTPPAASRSALRAHAHALARVRDGRRAGVRLGIDRAACGPASSGFDGRLREARGRRCPQGLPRDPLAAGAACAVVDNESQRLGVAGVEPQPVQARSCSKRLACASRRDASVSGGAQLTTARDGGCRAKSRATLVARLWRRSSGLGSVFLGP